MANIRSAAKRILVSRRQAEVNRRRRSRVRTLIKKAHVAVGGGDKSAVEQVRVAQNELQRAVRKGLLHKNTAARRQSSLARLLKGSGLKKK
ncbi:MAG: 30S ribosomal protein S20 [Alphaproteobacteria bacterium GM202ARS2]|nr:30S ribosomal protein S20 [Alphaproteobacteria bacterium GM202ARS2]